MSVENSVLNVKALAGTFNKEKALVWVFSGHCENFAKVLDSSNLKVAWMRSAASVFRPDSFMHSSSDSTASNRFLLSAFLYFST